MKILLAGALNAGKSTIYNALSTANAVTANYAGATVQFTCGYLKASLGIEGEIIDSPGLQSLTPSTPEQVLTAEALFDSKQQDADVVIAVVDATQLSRHLYLVTQLKDAGFNLLVCVTMIDILERNGQKLNLEKLKNDLDLPCLRVDARKKEGMKDLIVEVVKIASLEQKEKIKPSKISEEDIQKRFAKTAKIEKNCIVNLPQKALKLKNTLDKYILHPFWGLIIFFFVMSAFFSCIYWLASPAVDMVDNFFGDLVELTKYYLPSSWVTDILADGVVAGIGSVAVFLPQIIILFLIMGFLEDSGYLARGAMLIDRPLSAIGLNGRSFMPMLSGFACAIPSIMAARTLKNRNERILTIFILPLMTCSARLPVYALLLTILTPQDKPWIGGMSLAGLYFFGMIAGTIVATIISRTTAFKNRKSHFQLELPSYKMPVAKVVLKKTYQKSMMYLKKAGPVILYISIGLWVLTHLPAKTNHGIKDEYIAVSDSYAAKLGRTIEPVMKPLGLDWRAGVAMTMGFAAREVFVNSMAIIYRSDQGDKSEKAVQKGLIKTMSDATFEGTDKKIFTTSSCLGILLFFAIALQCFPTIAVAKNEIGSWKIPLIQLFVYTGGAYVLSVILVQSLRAFGVS